MRMCQMGSGIGGLVLASIIGLWSLQAKAVKPGEVGIISMQQVILSVEEGKQARAALEGEIKKKEGALAKQKEELDRLNQEWQSQSALLSEEARLKKQREFQEKFMNLRNEEMTFQNEIKQKEQEATQKIAMEAAKIVETIAKDKGLSMVFEAQSAGLVYVQQPYDMTAEVIEAYGKKATNSGKK